MDRAGPDRKVAHTALALGKKLSSASGRAIRPEPPKSRLSHWKTCKIRVFAMSRC